MKNVVTISGPCAPKHPTLGDLKPGTLFRFFTPNTDGVTRVYLKLDIGKPSVVLLNTGAVYTPSDHQQVVVIENPVTLEPK